MANAETMRTCGFSTFGYWLEYGYGTGEFGCGYGTVTGPRCCIEHDTYSAFGVLPVRLSSGTRTGLVTAIPSHWAGRMGRLVAASSRRAAGARAGPVRVSVTPLRLIGRAGCRGRSVFAPPCRESRVRRRTFIAPPLSAGSCRHGGDAAPRPGYARGGTRPPRGQRGRRRPPAVPPHE